MPQKTVRPIELDPETDRWLAQQDEDPDELITDLLRAYRDQ